MFFYTTEFLPKRLKIQVTRVKIKFQTFRLKID